MLRATSTLNRSVAALFAAGLLLTACGSSGGSDGAKATTTTKAKTTTTVADKTTTTAGDAPVDGPTAADLEAILPTVDEVGGTFKVDTDTDFSADSAIEKATVTECPGAAALLAPPEDGEPTIGFVGDGTETLRVTLSPGVEQADPTDLQAALDEINACDTVTAEEGGLTFSATFAADTNDTYGDQGVQIQANVTITDGTDSYDVTKYRLQFIDGTVGVVISGGDGLADDGKITPIDTDGLEATAKEMATRVNEL